MKISLSILDMDFADLRTSLKQFETSGIDSFHMDIMDGNFVDNISFGPGIVRTVHEISPLTLHSHLMITEPGRFVGRFFDAGSASVTVHVESLNEGNMSVLERNNIGLSLNPDVPVECLFPYLHKVNRILIMSVNAGYGGQEFIESSLDRISMLASKRKGSGSDYIISVDGGINLHNACKCMEAGADELVVGSYITKAENPTTVIAGLKSVMCKDIS
ncbi:ribulose-phosphate 3-epimerase [Elusimicrobiota bacterium]